MIRDPREWTAWPDYERNLTLLGALHGLAQALGVFEKRDPLEGLEHKIALAARLNGRKPQSLDAIREYIRLHRVP